MNNAAMVTISANVNVTNGNSFMLPFATEVYDDSGFYDYAGNPTRLTVPANVSRVRVGANVTFNSVDVGLAARIFIAKNNSLNYAERAAQTAAAVSAQQPRISVVSGLIDVAEGDYFEVSVQVPGETNYNISSTNTNFWIEAVA